MFWSSCKKVSVSFTKISSIAATTQITINKIRTNFLIKGIFKTKQCTKFAWRLENNFNKLFCSDLTNLDLNCNDFSQ